MRKPLVVARLSDGSAARSGAHRPLSRGRDRRCAEGDARWAEGPASMLGAGPWSGNVGRPLCLETDAQP